MTNKAGNSSLFFDAINKFIYRFLSFLFRPIYNVNSFFMAVGKQLAWIALAMMVIVILLGVFFRYVLNDPLPWPDEAARFFMLWMTALVAPSAFRFGGFVSIDTLARALPRRLSAALNIIILTISAVVLYHGIQIGWKHTMGFGGNFESSSLKIPLSFIGLETFKMKLRYMYGSLLVATFLLFLVAIELILKSALNFLNPSTTIDDIGSMDLK